MKAKMIQGGITLLLLLGSLQYIKYQKTVIEHLNKEIIVKDLEILKQQNIITSLNDANDEKDNIQNSLQKKINLLNKDYNNLKDKFNELSKINDGNNKDINELLIKNKELMQEVINKESNDFVNCLRDLDACELKMLRGEI